MSKHKHPQINRSRWMNQYYAEKGENESCRVMLSSCGCWPKQNQQAYDETELAGNRWIPRIKSLGEKASSKTHRQNALSTCAMPVHRSSDAKNKDEQTVVAKFKHCFCRRYIECFLNPCSKGWIGRWIGPKTTVGAS